MSVRRVYRMIAKADRGGDLLDALRHLAGRLASLDGSQGIEVLSDADDPLAYVFIERWSSVDCQKAAGARLGKGAFAEIGPTLAGPPEQASLTLVGEWPADG